MALIFTRHNDFGWCVDFGMAGVQALDGPNNWFWSDVTSQMRFGQVLHHLNPAQRKIPNLNPKGSFKIIKLKPEPYPTFYI